jgi:hypothetical protein
MRHSFVEPGYHNDMLGKYDKYSTNSIGSCYAD